MPPTARIRTPRRRYGNFPTTADVGIWARGPTASRLLEGLGLALFAQMTDLRRVRPTDERHIAASGADAPSLVVAFLSELLLLQQEEGFIGRDVHVSAVGTPATSALARVAGERFDARRHTARAEVKAVTMHRLEFDPARGRARVILDI
jgi:SHS2 domain-containing protein